MRELQKYTIGYDQTNRHDYIADPETSAPVGLELDTELYLATEVDARLALKDAEIERLKEQDGVIRSLLSTAFSGIKGGFTLPDWWLPRTRIALHPEIYQTQEQRSAVMVDIEARIALMQRAIEWCLENGAYRNSRGVLELQTDEDWTNIPAEFAEIIKGTANV